MRRRNFLRKTRQNARRLKTEPTFVMTEGEQERQIKYLLGFRESGEG